MPQYNVVFSPAASDDLVSIREYIANENSRAVADQFVEGLVRYCESFASAPHRGTRRDEIRTGLRIVGWRRTVTIAFAVSDVEPRVDIAGVFYRGCNVAAAMAERP